MWSNKGKSSDSAGTREHHDTDETEIKVVVVGDAQCGKTRLIQRYITDSYNDIHTPTGFEKYGYSCTIAEQKVNFSIWDTSGTAAYDTVRPLAHSDAKVFLLCFNIGDPESLTNASNKWIREVRTHGCLSAPVILCGCKNDLRQDKETIALLSKMDTHPITSEEGVSMSRALGAATYVETSAKTASCTVRDAFNVAALAALGKLNKLHNNKQKQIGRSKSKRDLKAELKGRAKSCCVM